MASLQSLALAGQNLQSNTQQAAPFHANNGNPALANNTAAVPAQSTAGGTWYTPPSGGFGGGGGELSPTMQLIYTLLGNMYNNINRNQQIGVGNPLMPPPAAPQPSPNPQPVQPGQQPGGAVGGDVAPPNNLAPITGTGVLGQTTGTGSGLGGFSLAGLGEFLGGGQNLGQYQKDMTGGMFGGIHNPNAGGWQVGGLAGIASAVTGVPFLDRAIEGGMFGQNLQQKALYQKSVKESNQHTLDLLRGDLKDLERDKAAGGSGGGLDQYQPTRQELNINYAPGPRSGPGHNWQTVAQGGGFGTVGDIIGGGSAAIASGISSQMLKGIGIA